MQSSRLAAWVAAAIVFIFGALLLFLPDTAQRLDELSVGGERDSTQGVVVDSVTETSTDDLGNTTTTTTETIHRENLGSPWVRIFGSPAIVFLFRILVVAILAFLIAALIYRTAVARFTIRGGSPWMELAELDRQDAVDALDDLLLGTPRLREKVDGLRVVTKEKIRRGAPGFQVDRTLEDGTLLAGLPYPISKVFEDPNVAMSSFRIELEQRLRKLANSRPSIRPSTSRTCWARWRQTASSRRPRYAGSPTLWTWATAPCTARASTVGSSTGCARTGFLCSARSTGSQRLPREKATSITG